MLEPVNLQPLHKRDLIVSIGRRGQVHLASDNTQSAMTRCGCWIDHPWNIFRGIGITCKRCHRIVEIEESQRTKKTAQTKGTTTNLQGTNNIEITQSPLL